MNPIFYNHPYLVTDRITHGFFGRSRGVSTGIYEGLNCGLGSYDDIDHVRENRRRVCLALGTKPEGLSTLYQIHSPLAVTVSEPITGTAPQADALVTDQPGITLGILTADCAPILFADHAAGIIGAAHAGWKGAYSGVIEATLAAMEKLGAERERIHAVIGPCIAQASYEVGPEFFARFAPGEQQQFFIPSEKPGHLMFDLPSYVAYRLRGAGLQHVAMLAKDTASDEEHFFSYRRATLRGEPDYGRQISAIALRTQE